MIYEKRLAPLSELYRGRLAADGRADRERRHAARNFSVRGAF